MSELEQMYLCGDGQKCDGPAEGGIPQLQENDEVDDGTVRN